MSNREYINYGETRMSTGATAQDFGTGSIRDSQKGKTRYDLISPIFLTRLAVWCTLGAIKYSPRNWEKGQPLHQYVASLWRHLMAFMEGKDDEDHLAACAWNIMAFIHTEKMCLTGQLPEILLTAGMNKKYTEEQYETWLSDKKTSALDTNHRL